MSTTWLQRPAQLLAAIAALVVIGTSALAVVVLSGGSSTAADSLVLSGVVQNEDGSPAPHVPVRMTALPSTGMIPIGSTMTADDGTFTLDTTGCCDSTADELSHGVVDPDSGWINLELVGEPPEGIAIHDFVGELHYDSSSETPSAATLSLTNGRTQVTGLVVRANYGVIRGAEVLDGREGSTSVTSAPPSRSLPRGKKSDSGDSTYNGATVVAPDAYKLSEYPQPTTPPDPVGQGKLDCLSYTDWRDYGDVTTDRWVHNQVLSTRAHGTEVYDWSTTNQTKLEVAITGAGPNMSTGAQASRTQMTETGVEVHAGHMTTVGLLLEWRYLRQRAFCLYQGGGGYWMDRYRWIPLFFTGGNHNVHDVTANWTCTDDNRTSSDNKLWVTQNQTTIWSGFFQIGGVGLNLEQTDSEDQKATYFADAGERQYLCGNDAVPTIAHFAREVSPR